MFFLQSTREALRSTDSQLKVKALEKATVTATEIPKINGCLNGQNHENMFENPSQVEGMYNGPQTS